MMRVGSPDVCISMILRRIMAGVLIDGISRNRADDLPIECFCFSMGMQLGYYKNEDERQRNVGIHKWVKGKRLRR